MSKIDLSGNPVIAAVKDDKQLETAIKAECSVIFLLFGDILNIASLCDRVRSSGKHVIVHIDLINGLSSREIAADFIAGTTKADGIISTKPAIIRRAKELGLFTILRVFVIDSKALSNLEREVEMSRPDVVEILPGVMPDVISAICSSCTTPIVAGGLISSKKDILAALSAGAVAVSTTHEESWTM